MNRSAQNLPRRQFLASAARWASAPWWLSALGRMVPDQDPSRRLIFIWLNGGCSHLDTFDAKPEAPPEIRGDLPTQEAGEDLFFSALLPELARRVPHCVVLRSLTGGDGEHRRAAHTMLTGRRVSSHLVYPFLGTVLDPSGGMPSCVAIPTAHQYARQGFLPASHAPFEVGNSPARPRFAVPHLEPAPASKRATEWTELVDGLDGAPRSADEKGRDLLFQTARRLSQSPEARATFDLKQEPSEVRERYGAHTEGQSCLLARRLVEAGVRTVFVRSASWDNHRDLRRAFAKGFTPRLPILDQAVSALLDDLRERQLWETVTVVVATEFGRTPRLNALGGRDHWPRAYSSLLFGAGLKEGVVYGATDGHGAEVVRDAVSPTEFVATVFAALGVDATRELTTPDGQPLSLVEPGVQPVRAILA